MFKNRGYPIAINLPIYIATPSGKPLKIRRFEDLEEEYKKNVKIFEALKKKKDLTDSERKKLVLVGDDVRFLADKLDEFETRGYNDPRPGANEKDERLTFPLDFKTPQGNRYVFESFDDLNRLEDKAALEREFEARLGSTYKRKSREEIAKELDADLNAIREKKREAMNKGYRDTRPINLSYPSGVEIPTEGQNVTSENLSSIIDKELRRLSDEFNRGWPIDKLEYKYTGDDKEQEAKILKEQNDYLAKRDYLQSLKEMKDLNPYNLRELQDQYNGRFEKEAPKAQNPQEAPKPTQEKELNAKELIENLAREVESNAERYKYPIEVEGMVINNPKQLKSFVSANKRIATEDISPEEGIIDFRAFMDQIKSQGMFDHVKTPEGLVQDVNRNVVLDPEKVRLAKIQEEASQQANVPFEENPYAKIAELDPMEVEGLNKARDIARESEGGVKFPLEVIFPEEYKGSQRKLIIRDKDHYEKVRNLYRNAITNPENDIAKSLANQYQLALDALEGTYKSAEIFNRSKADQKFEYPETDNLSAAERFIHPRESFERGNYRDATERYMNPDWLRSDYRTLKDELVDGLRQRAVRRFEDSLKDLNWQYKANKMGRTGFFDAQKGKMFTDMMNELNTQDKELSLQAYALNEQNAAARAREAREGLQRSENYGAASAATSLKMEELERQKALEAYKINKLEEEAKLQRRRQAAADLITAGRLRRDQAQQGLNVQSAEFMRKQGYPKEKLESYLDTLKKASIGTPPMQLPEREQFFEQRMLPRAEPPKAERELDSKVSTAPVQPMPEPPSTMFKDTVGLGLAGADFWLNFQKYKDQKALQDAELASKKAAASAPPAATPAATAAPTT